MDQYKIIDNFLNEEDHLKIKNLMLSYNFPWYYNSSVVREDELEKHFQFTHVFYNNFSFQSEFSNALGPLIEKINPASIIRIKANLGPVYDKIIEQGYHTDFDFKCKTAIYYLNTNNGYTIFEDGTKVESVANRFVEFDSLIPHSGTTHTDEKVRCLINFNYF